MAAKIYNVIKTHRGKAKTITGTMEELEKYFGYILECGNSWNRSIKMTGHKTIGSLVKDLNKSVKETQGGCYSQDYYEAA